MVVHKMKSKTLLKIIILLLILFHNSFSNSNTSYDFIKASVHQYYQQQLNITEDELIITYKRIPEALLNYSDTNIEVFSQKRILKPGSQSIWVKCIENGKLLYKTPITIDVRVSRKIIVANSDLSHGTLINRSMLQIEKRLLGKDWLDYYTDLNALENQQTKQFIKKGAPVLQRMVKMTPLVQRGQDIRIEIRSKNLTVAVPGIAKEDGVYGQMIDLKLAETGKVLCGFIESKNLIVVYQE